MQNIGSLEFISIKELIKLFFKDQNDISSQARYFLMRYFRIILVYTSFWLSLSPSQSIFTNTILFINLIFVYQIFWRTGTIKEDNFGKNVILYLLAMPMISLTYPESINKFVLKSLMYVSLWMAMILPQSYSRKFIAISGILILKLFLQTFFLQNIDYKINGDDCKVLYDFASNIFFGMTGLIFIMYVMNLVLLKRTQKLKAENLNLITKIKQLEQKLVDMNHEVTGSKKLMDRFLLSLSHEFRNPINAALGNIELALDHCKDNDIKNLLINARVSTEMFFHLVSNLLDASKIDNRILELHFQPHDLYTIIEKTWSIIHDQLSKKELVGEILIDMKIPQVIRVDSHFFKKILLNLLLNGIKFTNRGSVMAMISWIDDSEIKDEYYLVSRHFKSHFATISHSRFKKPAFASPTNFSMLTKSGTSPAIDDIPLETSSNLSKIIPFYQLPAQISLDSVTDMAQAMKSYVKFSNCMSGDIQSPQKQYRRYGPSFSTSSRKGILKIEVLDSGSGIDPTTAKHFLFKKFSSKEEGNNRLGTGLGLWITKQLCLEMKGDIRVYSQIDEGSQFVILLPIEVAEPQEIRKANKTLDSIYGIQRNVKLRALVVDDDKYNRELNTKFLSKSGVNVEKEAANGEEAVKIFKESPANYFDLILMDIEMPIKNGKEATKEIRAIERERNSNPTQVVFATGNCDKSEYDICMDPLGDIQGNFFYRKPVSSSSFEEFVLAIKKKKAQQKFMLIIEKDLNIIRALRSIIQYTSIYLLVASNNQEALSIVEDIKDRITVIFLNAETTELRAKEFMVEMRSNHSWMRCEKIGYGTMITSKNNKFYQDWLGIKKCLVYPFEASEIIGTVQNLVSRTSF